jgi:hypothetical protein
MSTVSKTTLKTMAAVTLFAVGTSFAIAQQNSPPAKSKSEIQEKGPSMQEPSSGVGSRPIGPPDTAVPAPGKNPTGESKSKQRSEQNDPRSGGLQQKQ